MEFEAEMGKAMGQAFGLPAGLVLKPSSLADAITDAAPPSKKYRWN